VDSAPLRQFLTAFFSQGFWDDESRKTAALEFASLAAFGLEDSMNALIFHGEGYDLLDAHLSCAPDSNYIYCRFSSGTGPLVIAAGILTRLGFSVSRTQHGLTGWLASQPPEEMTAKLKAIGKMAAFLLRPPSSEILSDGTEDEINRFFRMCDCFNYHH
jgi:hypothetical protein